MSFLNSCELLHELFCDGSIFSHLSSHLLLKRRWGLHRLGRDCRSLFTLIFLLSPSTHVNNTRSIEGFKAIFYWKQGLHESCFMAFSCMKLEGKFPKTRTKHCPMLHFQLCVLASTISQVLKLFDGQPCWSL